MKNREELVKLLNSFWIADIPSAIVSAEDNKEQILAAYDALIAEQERMKRGDFTPEEIQNFCHKVPETVPAEEFANGCAEYQKKLYGCAPHADELKRLKEENVLMRDVIDREAWLERADPDASPYVGYEYYNAERERADKLQEEMDLLKAKTEALELMLRNIPAVKASMEAAVDAVVTKSTTVAELQAEVERLEKQWAFQCACRFSDTTPTIWTNRCRLHAGFVEPLEQQIEALTAELEELRKCREVAPCGDRDHAGLRRVIAGFPKPARLPDPRLGQDAAFIAGMLGDYEAKLEKIKELGEAHQKPLHGLRCECLGCQMLAVVTGKVK